MLVNRRCATIIGKNCHVVTFQAIKDQFFREERLILMFFWSCICIIFIPIILDYLRFLFKLHSLSNSLSEQDQIAGSEDNYEHEFADQGFVLQSAGVQSRHHDLLEVRTNRQFLPLFAVICQAAARIQNRTENHSIFIGDKLNGVLAFIQSLQINAESVAVQHGIHLFCIIIV